MATQGTPVLTASSPPPARWLRRPLAAAAAFATFSVLGAVWGPVASATPPDTCESGTGLDLASVLADGGTYTLAEPLTLQCELSVASDTTAVLDLGGNTLTIYGNGGTAGVAHGADGSDAPATLTNDGTLVITDGTLNITGGSGGAGVAGSSGAPGEAGTEGSPEGGPGGAGGDGGSGGDGGDSIAGYGIVVLRNANLVATGGAGGVGGTGGTGGAGGIDYVTSEPAANGASGSPGTDGEGGAGLKSGVVASDGGSVTISSGAEHSVLIDGNGATNPASFTAYGSGAIVSAVGKLAAEPVSWPTRDGKVPDGWFTAATGGAPINDTPIWDTPTVYAHWPAAPPPPAGDSSSGSGGSSSPTTTSIPATTAAPVTTSAAPSTDKTSAPSTTTSIPTNNVKDPVTFTSSQAPTAPPLPGASSVNDTSASQFDVDTHTPTQGGDLTLVARGFKPGSVVDFWMHSAPTYLGSAIADVLGIAVLPVKLDKSLVGEHHVQSVGIGLLGEPRNLAQPITIAAPSALASTGFPTLPVALISLIMIAAGAALLMMRRRPLQRGSHL